MSKKNYIDLIHILILLILLAAVILLYIKYLLKDNIWITTNELNYKPDYNDPKNYQKIENIKFQADDTDIIVATGVSAIIIGSWIWKHLLKDIIGEAATGIIFSIEIDKV